MSNADGLFSISEFAALTGLPEEVLRGKVGSSIRKQDYFSIQELADRWRCSRGTVYNRIRAEGARVLDFSARGRKGKKAIASSEVLGIEAKRTKRLND